MKDFLNNVTAWLRHNQALVAAVVLCILLTVWGFGCQVETTSPTNPALMVTRVELDQEIETFAAKAAAAYQDLTSKEEVRESLLNAGLVVAQGGDFSPLGLATTLMGILGIGAVMDNRRKDVALKSKNNTATDTAKAIVSAIMTKSGSVDPSAGA